MKVVRMVANPLVKQQKGIDRSISREAHQNSLRRLAELNPDAILELTLIVGMPGDNYDSFLGSLDFVLSMHPRDLHLVDFIPESEMLAHPEQFGIVIDRNPPHQLLYNETFPWEEYFQAKHVGYHAKLFQKDRFLRERLIELVGELGGAHVDLYAGLAEAAVERGLPTLQGKDVRDISSAAFDERTDRFLADPENERQLHELFFEYEQHIRGSRQANHAAIPRKKIFERWVRGGL